MVFKSYVKEIETGLKIHIFFKNKNFISTLRNLAKSNGQKLNQ